MGRRFTADEDRILIEHYSTLTLHQIAEQLGRRWNCVQQRRTLLARRGLLDPATRAWHRPWTAQEDAEIRGRLGWDTLAEIARGLSRSVSAVKVHIQRLGLSALAARRKRPRYCGRDVGAVFGVDEKTVALWIKRGLLHATRSQAGAGRHRRWDVTFTDIERFIREHPARYERRRITPGSYWRELADTVAARAERQYSVAQAALRLGLVVETIRRYIRARKISAMSLPWCGGFTYRISAAELSRAERELSRSGSTGHRRRAVGASRQGG